MTQSDIVSIYYRSASPGAASSPSTTLAIRIRRYADYELVYLSRGIYSVVHFKADFTCVLPCRYIPLPSLGIAISLRRWFETGARMVDEYFSLDRAEGE